MLANKKDPDYGTSKHKIFKVVKSYEEENNYHLLIVKMVILVVMLVTLVATASDELLV